MGKFIGFLAFHEILNFENPLIQSKVMLIFLKITICLKNNNFHLKNDNFCLRNDYFCLINDNFFSKITIFVSKFGIFILKNCHFCLKNNYFCQKLEVGFFFKPNWKHCVPHQTYWFWDFNVYKMDLQSFRERNYHFKIIKNLL